MEHGVAEHRDDQREEQAHLGLGADDEIEVPEEEDEQQQRKHTDQREDDRGGSAEVQRSLSAQSRPLVPEYPSAYLTSARKLPSAWRVLASAGAAYTGRRHARDGH